MAAPRGTRSIQETCSVQTVSATTGAMPVGGDELGSGS